MLPISFTRSGSLSHLKIRRSPNGCVYVSCRNSIKTSLAGRVVPGPSVSLRPVMMKLEWVVTIGSLQFNYHVGGERLFMPSAMSSLKLNTASTCGAVPSYGASMTCKTAFSPCERDLLATSRSSEWYMISVGTDLLRMRWVEAGLDGLDIVQSGVD